MMAATNGRCEIARMLLRAGARWDISTDSGANVRTIAEELGEWDFLDVLGERGQGSDPSTKTGGGDIEQSAIPIALDGNQDALEP
jgi:hypothetical protein